MALVTRARAAGILSLCLLLLSSLSATGALASAAPSAAPTQAVNATVIVIGAGSCVGTDACLNAVGPIGDNSCIGDYSCNDTTGSIGSGSCVGIGYPGSGGSCTGATGNIGASSCNGSQTCGIATGSNNLAGVGDDSCNGGSACAGTAGTVGDGSCDGESACTFSTGNVGDDSCTGGSACYSKTGTIGHDSCNGSSACNNSTANIGSNSCNGENSCVVAIASSIGDNSCNGAGACDRVSKAVGNCANNKASVPAVCGVPKPDAAVRKGSGAFVGNNIYNTTGNNQARTGAAARGSTITFGISFQNDATILTEKFTLKATGSSTAMYDVTYFNGTTNITDAIVAGNYTTRAVAPGATFSITAKVKVKTSATVGSSVTRLVTIKSLGDGTKKDAVLFTGKRS